MLLPFGETKNYTHDDLIIMAREWLKPKCSVVVSEIAAFGLEQPDAIGWKGRETILIECKASRADFLADKKKIFRQFLAQGLGDYRYYLAPVGVIKHKSELLEGFGWLEVNPMTGKITTRRKAEIQPEKYVHREVSILLSVIRRIGQTEPEGIRIKCYTMQNKCRAVVEIDIEDDEGK